MDDDELEEYWEFEDLGLFSLACQAFCFAFLLLTGVKEKAVSGDGRNH